MKVQHFSTDKKEVMVSNGFPMAQRIFIDKRECLETVKLRNQFMAPSGTSILNSMPSVESLLPHQCQSFVEKTEQQIIKVFDIWKC